MYLNKCNFYNFHLLLLIFCKEIVGNLFFQINLVGYCLFVIQLTSILCSNMIPFAEFQCEASGDKKKASALEHVYALIVYLRG